MQPLWILLLLPLSIPSVQRDDGQFDDIDPGDEHLIEEVKENGYGHCFSKKRKSPIDIDLATVKSVTLPPLVFTDYSSSENVSQNVESNFTASVHGYTNWTKKPILSGGPLDGEYHLMAVQWDMHAMLAPYPYEIYGTYGHTVNGGKHDFELHLVHTKNGMSIEDAKLVPEGIVMVSVFISRLFGSRNGTKLITTALPTDVNTGRNFSTEEIEKSKFMSSETRQKGPEFKWLSPDRFFPNERDSYFVYNGTFVHPPCIDDVTWIILTNPSYLHIDDFHIFMNAAGNLQSLTTRAMSLKKRNSSKVLFNIPEDVNCISSTSSNTVGTFLDVLAGFICGVAVGLLVFYMNVKNSSKIQ